MIKKTIKTVVGISLFLVVLVLVLFFTYYFSFKSIYTSALSGKAFLSDSVRFMQARQFEAAQAKAELARDSFDESLEALSGVQKNILLENISSSNNILTDTYLILSAGRNLARSAEIVASLGTEAYGLLGRSEERSFESLGVAEKRDFLQMLYESSPELNGLAASIDLSVEDLKKINPNGVFYPLKDELKNIISQTEDVSDLLAKIVPFTEIFPELAGYPQKSTYLLVLQNRDELRPTGGFIGTYGILETDSGEIERLDTHDIYHLDMPVKDRVDVDPPEPLKKYLGVDKWYLRDANWSADWQESAEKIQWFYELENSKMDKPDIHGDFNGVIGITPDFVIDLLKLSGPVEIEGEVYNQDNFMDLLQYRVEKGYVELGVPSWHRKEVIGEILAELKKRLFGMNFDNLPDLLTLLDENLNRKDIILHFSDPTINQIAKNGNYGGEINKTGSDFLMVVDANMAAYKTDRVVGKQINYDLEQSRNGLFAKLKINYSHRGSFDWKTTRYRSYTRIYVPKGSQLINSWGGSDEPVKVYDEGDKTVFAGFLSVEPGKINNIYMEYKLPERINIKTLADNEYSLYVQKQPGLKVEELNINFNFDKIIESYKPTGFFVEEKGGNTLKWRADLNVDREFVVKF